MKWKPAIYAPRDAWPVIVSVTITCRCAKGGVVVLSAARENGESIIADFEHEFEITHFLEIPKPPAHARTSH